MRTLLSKHTDISSLDKTPSNGDVYKRYSVNRLDSQYGAFSCLNTGYIVCLCGRQTVNLFEEEFEIVRFHKWSDTCYH
jgi:hypothetical protein